LGANLRKPLKILALLLSIWFGIHIFIVIIDGLNDESHIADVGVVLGNKIEPNGQPSPRLKSRLDKAIVLYHQGFFKYIIVSGAIGKEGYDEADVMKNYLVKNRILSQVIYLDHAGNNTFLTAKNSKKLLTQLNLDSVFIITQYYHITRTKLAFSKVGFKKIYSGHAGIIELRDVYSLAREFLAFYKYLWISEG
jgi:vancomycin permeability regulator SanA